MINVADLVNPETGKTYRQENSLKKHAIPLDALVEINDSGVRMFVVKLGRDCDGTPLYWLACKKTEELYQYDQRHGGYAEHSLEVVKTDS